MPQHIDPEAIDAAVTAAEQRFIPGSIPANAARAIARAWREHGRLTEREAYCLELLS